MLLPTLNTFLKVFELESLLNINKSAIIKSKNKLRKSQNKKNIISKVDKTTTRFTKRNFSNFKIVKAKIDNKVKCVRKNERVEKSITIRVKRSSTAQVEENLTTRVEENTITHTIVQIEKSTTTRVEENSTTITTTQTKQNVRILKITRATISIF